MPLEHQEPQSENNTTEPGDQVAHDQSGDGNSGLPPTSAVMQPPQPPEPQSQPPRETGWRENVTLGIEALGLTALVVYTVFSILQWAQIRYTNQLTARALDGSDKSLTQTLAKMQGQTDATNKLATQAKTQADQAIDSRYKFRHSSHS